MNTNNTDREKRRAFLASIETDPTRTGDEGLLAKEQLRSMALEDEVEELKARAEKAEAELEQTNVVLRYATKTKDQYHSERDALEQERDALRKALEELLRMYCLEKRVQGHPCPENISTLSPMYAALASTAKQEPDSLPHLPSCDALDWNPEGIVKPCNCKAYRSDAKPRTCGECAHCGTMEVCETAGPGSPVDGCPCFTPRADAQKGTNT